MKQPIIATILSLLVLAVFSSCGQKKEKSSCGADKSYAVYAEYARGSNKKMENGLNRRVFDTAHAQNGKDISLGKNGVITLEPGTYHISGFSMVSMQAGVKVVNPVDGFNYPGYCIVYPVKYENDTAALLKNNVAIGTATSANIMVPCIFETIYTCTEKTDICVGHQSGADFKTPVYLSVYDVEGAPPTDYHLFAKISIIKL